MGVKTKGRTARAAIWSAIASIFQLVANVAVVVVIARLLEPEVFGVVAAAGVVSAFANVLAQLGVGPALVQRENLDELHIRVGFTISLLFGLLLAGAVTLSTPLIAAFFRMPELHEVLPAMSTIFVIRSLGIVAQAMLQREIRFRALAITSALSWTVGYAGVAIALAALGFGVWSLVLAHVCQVSIESLMLILASRHTFRPSVDREAAFSLLRFGAGITIGRIANFLALQGDNLIIGRALGPAPLGVYSRAYRLMALPANLLNEAFDSVMFSRMARMRDDAELRTAYQRASAAFSAVVMPAGILLCLLGPELVAVALGPRWGEAIAPLQILAAGLFFRAGWKSSASLLRATGQVFRLAAVQIAYGLSVLTFAWIGVRYGIDGVSIGVVGALVVQWSGLTFSACRRVRLGMRDFVRIHLPAIAASLALAAAVVPAAEALRSRGVSAAIVLLGAGAVGILVAVAVALVTARVATAGELVYWTETARALLGGGAGQKPTPATGSTLI